MTEARLDLQSHRAALERVTEGTRFAIRLPILGEVGVPPPEHLAYYAALGLLAALEVIEWPIALAIGVGHALAANQHDGTLHGIAEALESA